MRTSVAYFCMEFGIDPALPIYSGGLGVLAGDVMKTAFDVGAPLTGIGIFWSEGYGRQRIDALGRPREEWHVTPRDAVERVPVEVTVTIAGRDVRLGAWRVTGFLTAPLYLLEPLAPEDRWITRRLYGGGARDRVAQEIVLGVGGVRLLRALGLSPDVYHFNEGHAVFAGLELVRERLAAGARLREAVEATRAQVAFTTHTPVDAGNERHPLALLAELGADLGLPREALVALGGDPFDMTAAGLRLAGRANAVAKRHGETARRMWRGVEGGAPILAITNGVHVPTWQDRRVAAAAGGDELWRAHQMAKGDLLAAIAGRTGVAFAQETLLIGFARRATGYKRPDLILGDSERLDALLGAGRMQLVFAGKAHPNDAEGRAAIARIVAASRRFPRHVVFLEDYDLALGALLTRGCDVWLNNPRPPLEASGTSGMKAALNGVLNLSVLDGWWPEGCRHGETGWSFGGPTPDDARDREELYALLEGEILPRYYEDRPRWITMMEWAIQMARTRFSSERMLRDYDERLYEPLGRSLGAAAAG